MKNLILTIIFVWYFGLRIAEGSVDNAFINVVSGPYATEALCQSRFNEAKALFGEEGVVYAACKDYELKGWGI